ncbi:hypothetical protein RRG08_040884 [Elysia crispata]|uniref:Uncharacterized protein n=1 Tax=Elysia crispata TaxID=231223 RepID=A0AAE1B067_9GAST|nr:hypothetical protein RRG08_040884 [Elysia crispata]
MIPVACEKFIKAGVFPQRTSKEGGKSDHLTGVTQSSHCQSDRSPGWPNDRINIVTRTPYTMSLEQQSQAFIIATSAQPSVSTQATLPNSIPC